MTSDKLIKSKKPAEFDDNHARKSLEINSTISSDDNPITPTTIPRNSSAKNKQNFQTTVTKEKTVV
jgi:hypothetical protein